MKCNDVALVLLLLHFAGADASIGRLDPCATPGLLSKGAGLYIGLAFWPGGSLEDWGPAIDSQTTSPGLSPCLLTQYNGTNTTISHQAYLIQQGVVFSTYELKVDRLTVLRGNATEQASLFAQANSNSTTAGVVSVVAFRGAYRSPPRYFYSSNAGVTGGKGAVQELAVIARSDIGKLQSLQWNDMTCGSCGGRNSTRCLAARASDGVQYSCTVRANCTTTSNSTALADPCLPAVYVGFAGTDKKQRTFQSGYQITKINQFSLVAFYQRAAARVKGIYDTISLGALGSTGINDGGIGQDTNGGKGGLAAAA